MNLQHATGYNASELNGSITNAQLAGDISNDKLVNDSISINGTNVELGNNINISTGSNYTSGSGIDINSNVISVDLSDIMTNGSDNRVLTSTGTDGINAESNLTFNNSQLSINGSTVVSGNIIPSQNSTYDLGSGSNTFRDLYLSGSTLNLGGYSISVLNTSGANELVIKDHNNEYVHVHSHI